MNAHELNVFVGGVTRYFSETTGTPAEVGAPYLLDDARGLAGEFTGAIGISGKNRGCVYFTADRTLLSWVMTAICETRKSDENMLDLVGDIANTVSGNARQYFGSDFMISVPTLIHGSGALHLPKGVRSYAIPVVWKNIRATLIIVLEKQ